MPLHGDKPYPLDGHQDINAEWFNRLREKYSKASANREHSKLVCEAINALQTFWNHKASAEDSAHSITYPIATLSVIPSGSYADETIAIIALWHVLTEALFAWPQSRLPDLFALLSAIKELPRTVQIHKGEATDLETGTRPMTWDTFPFWHMVWSSSMREPGVIIWRAQKGTVDLSQGEYIRRKDIEAQLIALRIMPFSDRTAGYVIKTLETEPDTVIPANEAIAYMQNRLEFQIPAVASLMKYCGAKLIDWVVQKDGGRQRWALWEERLREVSDNDSEFDSTTRSAARAAYTEMQATGVQP